MIKVICIKDSIVRNISDFEKISKDLGIDVYDLFPKSGREYSVLKVVKGMTLQNTDNNIWYILSETGILQHHSSLFAISPNYIRDCKLDLILEGS